MSRRFSDGMTCCNRQRVQLGLACDADHQMVCAASAIKWQAANHPEGLAALIRDIVSAFPGQLAYVRLIAREAEALDVFIEQAALLCAALATKTDRQAFRSALVGTCGSQAYESGLTCGLSNDQLATFDTLMSAQWHRLRGKPAPGDRK